MLISEKSVGKVHWESFHNTTNSLAMGFLSPIFFAAIGLEFNFYSIQNYWLLIAILLVSYFSKIVGGFAGARIAGLNNRISITIGMTILMMIYKKLRKRLHRCYHNIVTISC